MSRQFPKSQAKDLEYAWHYWITEFMSGVEQAKPVLRLAGILETLTTPVPNFHIPLPPLGVGGIHIGEDRQPWPAVDVQLYEVKGRVAKMGPLGLTMTEEDTYEAQVKSIAASMAALGRAEKLFEDTMSAATMEASLVGSIKIGKKTYELLGADDVPVFSRNHYFDPVRKSGNAVSNTHAYPLTPDNALAVKTQFATMRDESGNPIFADQALEVALIGPSALEGDIEKCVERMYIAEVSGATGGGVSNVMYKKAKPVVLPQLRDPARWYMTVINRPRKPIAEISMMPMQRKMIGPGSSQFDLTQEMRVFSYQRAAYRLVDWRMWQTSAPGAR